MDDPSSLEKIKIDIICCWWGSDNVWGNLANKNRHSELALLRLQVPWVKELRARSRKTVHSGNKRGIVTTVH